MVNKEIRKTEVLKRIQEILAEHGGQESNIPVKNDHEYWILKREFQSLNTV